MVNQTFTTYYQEKEDLDVLLETGLNKYPGLEAINQLICTRNREFNEGAPNISTDITRGMHHTPNQNQHHKRDDNKGNVENAEYNDALICTPLTQLLTTKESALKSPGIQLNYDSDEDTTKDVRSPPCRRSKRCVNLTDQFRSPNFIRVIDPNSGLKSIEARVSGMIFAGIGNECYITKSHSFQFQGFVISVKIQRERIPCNFLEHDTRLKNSYSRSYASRSNYVFNERICIEKQYHMFYNRMNEYLLKYQQHIKF
ncbi:hypothetical protein LXL04_020206 [Taraxacum kok-saghyz]